jgi:predicted MFS family arabinose efflux permease
MDWWLGVRALFLPYAGDAATMLFVASAAGMLAGDVLMGRVLNEAQRRASAKWLRLWLALPFLIYIVHPGISLAALLAGSASIGYAASLAQQELLVTVTPRHLSGQVLGAESAARVTCQGLGALLAGGLAEAMNPGQAIALLALSSLLVSFSLTRSLARAAEHAADFNNKPAHPKSPQTDTSADTHVHAIGGTATA